MEIRIPTPHLGHSRGLPGDERRLIVAASGGLGQQLGARRGEQLAAEGPLIGAMGDRRVTIRAWTK